MYDRAKYDLSGLRILASRPPNGIQHQCVELIAVEEAGAWRLRRISEIKAPLFVLDMY
jgi:hypothetical protein